MKTVFALTAVATVLLAACSSTPTTPVKVEEVRTTPAPEASVVKPAAAPASSAAVTPTQPIAPAKPLEVAESMDGPFPPKGQGGDLGKRTIYYGFDEFAVPEDSKPVVSAHAAFLTRHAKAHLLVQGNCDERGSREYNLALGMRRAEGVKALLTLSGAADAQIEASSFGKEKPVDAGHDENAWAKNRRVDLVYQGE